MEEARTNKGPVAATSEISLEVLKTLKTSEEVVRIRIPSKQGHVAWVQTSAETRRQAQMTDLFFTAHVYQSGSRESLGEAMSGAQARGHGYYIKLDEEGNPMWKFFDKKNKEVSAEEYQQGDPMMPVLENTDENGNPMVPQELFVFKLEWNADYNAPMRNRPKGQDMLNLIPEFQIPLGEKSANAKYAPVDWTALGSIENLIKNPVKMKDKFGPQMELFVSLIPINKFAPSQQAAMANAEAGTRQSVVSATKLAETIDEDPTAED